MAVPRQLHLFKGKRQRGTAVVALNPTEFKFSCSVADFLRTWALPSWQWSHWPAGEERAAEFVDGERVSFAGARLQRMGAKRGWPDYILIAPKGHPRAGVAHFLELKRKRGGRLSDEQDEFRLWCLLNGSPHAVARDLAEVIAALTPWGVFRGKAEVQ